MSKKSENPSSFNRVILKIFIVGQQLFFVILQQSLSLYCSIWKLNLHFCQPFSLQNSLCKIKRQNWRVGGNCNLIISCSTSYYQKLLGVEGGTFYAHGTKWNSFTMEKVAAIQPQIIVITDYCKLQIIPRSWKHCPSFSDILEDFQTLEQRLDDD